MTALPKHKMTVDEYLVWAQDQSGRFELYAGVVYAMTPERAGHATVKFAVQTALREAIRRAGIPCHMLPDGMTVRVDAHTARAGLLRGKTPPRCRRSASSRARGGGSLTIDAAH
jgi:Uma2 family endonuclease